MENNFLIRLYVVGFLMLIFSIGIFYKLFQIQFIDGDKYRKIAEDKTVKNFIAKPIRMLPKSNPLVQSVSLFLYRDFLLKPEIKASINIMAKIIGNPIA